jgi:DNA-binding response OmpR family regulator
MAAILIVEDDKNQRLLLEEEFAGEGYKVSIAANGAEALAFLERAMPDLVVLDLAMPGMDGLDLMGRLLGLNNRLPVVIHTAYSSYQDNFMSWAADAYVVKRSDLSELKATVRTILGKVGEAPKRRQGFVPPTREPGIAAETQHTS